MRARKTVGRASQLLTGGATAPRPSRKQRYRIDGVPVDAALYAAFQAAQPAILLYLNGNGPRPHDPSMWFTAQDRATLRRLHAKGLAHNDPRYFDALIEALHAGDPLSRKEARDLAEHTRVMKDGFVPVLENRASELSTEAQALGRIVSVLQPKAKVGAQVIGGGLTRGHAIAEAQAALRAQWKLDLETHYKDHPLTRHISYRAEAGRLRKAGRVRWTTEIPGYELLRKTILPPLLRGKFSHLYS
jgi:hypothetical protein